MQVDALKRWPEEYSRQDGRVGGEHKDYCVTRSCQQDWKGRHKGVVRLAMICSIKTRAVIESMEEKMEAAEMKMMAKLVLGVMLKDRMKNKYI